MTTPNFNPSLKELRLFSLFLLLPAAFLFWKFSGKSYTQAIITTLVAVAILGCILPKLIKPLYLLLITLTWPIGFLINNLLLALIYFLILTPIALLKKKPLNLSYPPQKKSNFSPLPKSDPQSYYNPY